MRGEGQGEGLRQHSIVGAAPHPALRATPGSQPGGRLFSPQAGRSTPPFPTPLVTLAMVQLAPVPFDALVGRMFRELETKRSVFDLPAQRFVDAYPGRDLSVAFRERRASTPFGPAAGPHTQMAQNIALSWLAGGRVIECKTVQVNDAIEVPRPCIDMGTVGFNVEWSQELTVPQSLEEYVKGAMLIEMLKASGVGAGLPETMFDMSVGYDLAGIKSAKVRGFLDGMLDATAVVERLRAQIPDLWRKFRDLPFPTRISDTLTLSTFHGCPPGEIEAIVRRLIGEVGLDVVVKLNPTLLGRDEVEAILHGALGYHDIKVPERVYDEDAKWPEVVDMVERLAPFAAARGRSLGVKFSNTLVVENNRGFFPASERVMYLSGPAAASAGDRARRALPQRVRRPPAGLVLRRDRRAQFPRCGRPRPETGHGLQRPSAVRRLPARVALLRRARQADGRGGSEGPRGLHAQGARPGRGRARGSRPLRAARRPMPRRAWLGRRSARGGGRRLRGLGLGGARAEQRRLRQARGRRPALQRRRERDAAEEGRQLPRAVRLPDLRQVHPGLSQRRQLQLLDSRSARRRSSG